MTHAVAIIKCNEALGKRKRIRLLLGERARLDLVREGIAVWDRTHGLKNREDAWKAKMAARLSDEPYNYGSVWLLLIAQIVLPILIRWIIDNYFQGQTHGTTETSVA